MARFFRSDVLRGVREVQHDLEKRIARVYDAIDETITPSDRFDEFPPKQLATERVFGFLQDFSGGIPQPKLENRFFSAVGLIHGFRDRLGQKLPNEKHRIIKHFEDSWSLNILRHIRNGEEHGLLNDRGQQRPFSVDRIRNNLRIVLQQGKSVVCTQPITNGPQTFGTGAASIVLTADIHDLRRAKNSTATMYLCPP